LNVLVVPSNSIQVIDVRPNRSGSFTRPAHKYMNTQMHRCSRNAQKKPKTEQKQGNVMTQHNVSIKYLICYRASLTALDQL